MSICCCILHTLLTSSLNSPPLPLSSQSPGTMARSSARAALIFSRRRLSMSEWLALRSCSRDIGRPLGPTLAGVDEEDGADVGTAAAGLDWAAGRLERALAPDADAPPPRVELRPARDGSYSLSPGLKLPEDAELSRAGDCEPSRSSSPWRTPKYLRLRADAWGMGGGGMAEYGGWW